MNYRTDEGFLYVRLDDVEASLVAIGLKKVFEETFDRLKHMPADDPDRPKVEEYYYDIKKLHTRYTDAFKQLISME